MRKQRESNSGSARTWFFFVMHLCPEHYNEPHPSNFTTPQHQIGQSRPLYDAMVAIRDTPAEWAKVLAYLLCIYVST